MFILHVEFTNSAPLAKLVNSYYLMLTVQKWSFENIPTYGLCILSPILTHTHH